MSTEVDIRIQLNVSIFSVSNLTTLDIKRRKICLQPQDGEITGLLLVLTALIRVITCYYWFQLIHYWLITDLLLVYYWFLLVYNWLFITDFVLCRFFLFFFLYVSVNLFTKQIVYYDVAFHNCNLFLIGK